MARPRSGLRGIVHALGVHEGEGKLVASLIGFAAPLGLTTTFVEVAAYALFLQSWDAGDLPWV